MRPSIQFYASSHELSNRLKAGSVMAFSLTSVFRICLGALQLLRRRARTAAAACPSYQVIFSAGGPQQRPVYSAATCLRCCPAVTPPVAEGLVWTSAEASGVSAFTAASALLVVLSPDCPKLPLLSPVAASVGAPAHGKRQRYDAARSVRTAGHVAQIGCGLPASNGNDSGSVGKSSQPS